MYSRPPHRNIPRDLYGLPATPPNTRTPSPAPDRSSFSPAAALRRSRGARPVVIVMSVVIAAALLAGLAAAVLFYGV